MEPSELNPQANPAVNQQNFTTPGMSAGRGAPGIPGSMPLFLQGGGEPSIGWQNPAATAIAAGTVNAVRPILVYRRRRRPTLVYHRRPGRAPIPASSEEKLEEKLASGETTEVQGEESNEVIQKSKSSKRKDKKKAAVVNPSLPREPEPEIDDSDDPEWEPPVGSRWDDDDEKMGKDGAVGVYQGTRKKRKMGIWQNEATPAPKEKEKPRRKKQKHRAKVVSEDKLGKKQRSVRARRPQPCMEALHESFCIKFVTKKRSKKISVPRNMLSNSLVPFGGQMMVPYERALHLDKKHRAKVNLDFETTRVWKLLMGKATEPDGTDVGKERWWQQEREVFQGRANSFIARMRLVQGDRHFSPWKGSVVDSVVGVFLTQNVSDHLSSSAYMHLAASFPPGLVNSNCKDDATTKELECQRIKTTAVNDLQENESLSATGGMIAETANGVDGFTSESGFTSYSGVPDKAAQASTSKKTRTSKKKDTENIDWDKLRREACDNGQMKERIFERRDSVDWEAVRSADVHRISRAIRIRGIHKVLARRVQSFLNRLVRDHGSTNLEWLRDIPPDSAKDYLLSIDGLGLKSVECVRLLTLHHVAFPVDTNVARICVRLGWVPIQPLPESLLFHLLENYPLLETVQKYLWPRLCKLDQKTLYELHYQLITFGKVFCTKSKPNCNACPLRSECRHFASAFASARLALPAPEEKSLVYSSNQFNFQNGGMPTPNSTVLLQLEGSTHGRDFLANNLEPIIEEPESPREEELPESFERDIEDYDVDTGEIPTIKLNLEAFAQNLENWTKESNMDLRADDIAKALVTISTEAASIPVPKLKNVHRLRTEHYVYELPDSHPLVQKIGLDQREPGDPSPYLLTIWMQDDIKEMSKEPKPCYDSQMEAGFCNNRNCQYSVPERDIQSRYVRGTILVPCRTAMKGSFPLNGTYFQVNEVFADHKSSHDPIHVLREHLWNLKRRMVYFGTSVPAIFKGLTTEEIQECFWRGFVCVRGFEMETRAPRPLCPHLHRAASKLSRSLQPEATEYSD